MAGFSKIKFIILLNLSFIIYNSSFLHACQCPATTLSIAECDKYEVIFRGKILSSTGCNDKKGEVVFEIIELYKGITKKTFTVLYDCGSECAQTFNPGEEWIIYAKYKHVTDASMDWCSRSRKKFKNEKEDFYSANNGNTYEEEYHFLIKNLGTLKVAKENDPQTGQRNIIPNRNQLIITLLCSIAGIVFFYFLFNKYFK